jgi:pyrroline-5-carboxylate reductase
MKLGFIGTGAITSAIVTGLNALDAGQDVISVSPRNAEVAAGLAARFPNVAVAASNQAVLDDSDVVMLAIRPHLTVEVLSDLRFRPDHQVISLMAITPLERVSTLVAPASQVVRALPLPMVADLRGPTVIYPPDPMAAEVFNRLGTAIAIESADKFSAFSTATATIATYFAFAGELAEWLVGHDVPCAAARGYVGTVFQGLAKHALSQPQHSFTTLAGEFATRGGINEQVLAHIKKTGALAAVSDALNAVLQRMKAAQEGVGRPQRRAREREPDAKAEAKNFGHGLVGRRAPYCLRRYRWFVGGQHWQRRQSHTRGEQSDGDTRTERRQEWLAVRRELRRVTSLARSR